jgi:hypothetical protein
MKFSFGGILDHKIFQPVFDFVLFDKIRLLAIGFEWHPNSPRNCRISTQNNHVSSSVSPNSTAFLKPNSASSKVHVFVYRSVTLPVQTILIVNR